MRSISVQTQGRDTEERGREEGEVMQTSVIGLLQRNVSGPWESPGRVQDLRCH